MSNIKHWGSISEEQVRDKTGIQRVKFLNDFVALGYGVIDIDSKYLLPIFEPPPSVNKPEQ